MRYLQIASMLVGTWSVVLLVFAKPAWATVKTVTGCDAQSYRFLIIDETLPINSTILEFDSIGCLTIDNSPKSPVTAEQTSDPTKWRIKLSSTLDLETTKKKDYTIKYDCCSQVGTTALNYVLNLIVNGVNEFAPVFAKSIDYISLKESTKVGEIVYEMKSRNVATDEDFGQAVLIKYAIEEGNTTVFTIDNSLKGTIVLKKPLDFETNQVFRLNISGEENTPERKKAYTILYINVTDVDDQNPRFSQNTYDIQIPEGDYSKTSPNCFATSPPVYAYDGDLVLNENITYGLTEENDAYKSLFSIDEKGKLCIKKKIDKGVYFVNIKAMQEHNPEFRLALAVINLTVLDINDHAPVLSDNQYTAKVRESVALGTIVLVLSATDEDEGINAEFEFQLAGPESDSFNIETRGNQGILEVIKGLDREFKDVYQFQVYAKETKSQERQMSKKSNVTIIVLDVNDNSPVFTTPGNAHILENSTIGTFLTKIEATDKDLAEAGNITYSLLSSPYSDLFVINPHTGIISLNCSNCLDYGTTKDIFLIAQAKDHGIPTLSSLTSIPVKVIETEFAPPRFSSPVYQVNVRENRSPGFLIQLQASDPDSIDSDLIFSLRNSDKSLNSMVKVDKNGRIDLVVSPDAEQNSTLSFGVTVTDGHSVDQALVRVNVTDVNEYPPRIIMLQKVEILENSTVGTVVVKIHIEDDDVSNNGFTVWLDEGSNGKFHLDLNSSTVITTATFDRQTKSVYKMKIHATDYGLPPLTSSKNLEVIVTDSNIAPIFVDDILVPVSNYSFAVNESVPVGFAVGFLKVVDPDKGSSGAIMYQITSQSPRDDFELNEDSGLLTVKQPLNFEKNNLFTLKVKATDRSLYPKSAETDVKISISDVAEPPIWPSSHLQVYLTQSDICGNAANSLQPNSTKDVTVLSAQSDEKIYYYLLNMTTEFSLVKTTGLLVNNVKQTPGTYVLSVEACSRNQQNKVCSDATVTVIIQSDSVLTFCQGFYRKSVRESAPINTKILPLSVNKNDGKISYTIFSGNDDGTFKVSKEKGVLETVKPLDRETTDRYELIVLAKSSSEQAKAQVIINILDEPDSPPQFSTDHYKGDVTENFSSNTTPIVIVSVFDPDVNSSISFSIDPASDVSKGAFQIDPDGKIYLIKAIDYETMDPHLNHVFTFVVLVNDGKFTSNATVTIVVMDVNDQSPEFGTIKTNVSVSENVKIPYSLVKVEATDGDTNDRILYSIELMQPKGTENPFFINPLTGQIEVKSVLDREKVPSYTIQITAADAANHKTMVNMSVLVDDVNDNYPQFGSTAYTFNVTEGSTGLGTYITLEATDEDEEENAELHFNITSGNGNNAFQIEKTDSEVILKTAKEIAWTPSNAVINLVITATDSGPSPKSGTCHVTVFVHDTNDHHPVFSSEHYKANVLENVSNNTPVITDPKLKVSDDDDGSFGVAGLVFSLVENDLPFGIDPAKGSIYVKYSTPGILIDREKLPGYNITIVARDDDGSGLMSNTTLEIQVTDVDDSYPYFLNVSYEFSVEENVKFGTGVASVSARDNDTLSHVIFYTIENKEAVPFVLNFKTGELSVVAKLDASKNSYYSLNISASDGIHKTFVRVGINVTKVKDSFRCPFKSSGPIPFNLSEHQAVNEVFGTIDTLYDMEDMLYVIDDPVWKTIFSVNSSGGISLLQPLTPSVSNIEFDVHVKHKNKHVIQCVTYINMVILRKNDFAPEFCSWNMCGVQDYEYSIAEDASVHTIIGQVSTRDNDTGIDGKVYYNIDAKPTITKLISIDRNGVLRLEHGIEISQLKKDGVLTGDQSTVSFKLVASDGGTPSQSATATIHIKILASSSDVPVFSNNTYFMEVEEGLKPGAFIGNVSVTSQYPFSYSMSPGLYESVPFQVDSDTGEIVTTAKLDREEHPVFQFVIIAKENVRNRFSAASLVKVSVTDMNDNPPEFTKPGATVTVIENEKKENIITMNAQDPDEGQNAKVSYKFTKNYLEFSINSTTGEVSLIQGIDRETSPLLELVIKASDSGVPSLSSTTTLTVVIEDVNDETPTFSSSTFTKKIALKNNTDYTLNPIIEMNATDDDEGENGHVFYSLQQSGNPIFKIFPLTGYIYSIFPNLRIGTYNLSVVAADFGHPSLNSTAYVSIIVTSSYSPSPPQLTLTPTQVILFVGMRKGLDVNVTIETHNAKTVRLLDRQKESMFRMSSDNRILVNQDLTVNTLYALEVVAINTEGFNVTTVLEVRVLPLQFDQPVYAAHIEENHPVPYTLMDLNSFAERESMVPVRYYLQTITDDFNVNPIDGQVTLIKPLDREKVSMVTLNVSMKLFQAVTDSPIVKREASDSTFPSAVATITVYVTDINDNPPSFSFPGSTLVTSVPANAKIGYTIVILKAFDADIGDNKDIKYSVASGNNAAISLDDDSGVLSLVDPAAMKSVGRLELVVKACDVLNEHMCDNVTVEITMQDDELHLVLPVPLSDFNENQKSIMKKLSSVLDYQLHLLKSSVYIDNGKVDTSKTDIFFKAYHLKTNETISSQTLSSQASSKQKQINAIFEEFTATKKSTFQDFSDTAVIALIAVASGMFLASFVAIIIVCRLWKKQKWEQKKAETALNARLNADGTVNGRVANSSDPDEPLELDFDLDDSSLFEQNVISKPTGDMKSEVSSANQNRTPKPFIIIARHQETNMSDTDGNVMEETSDGNYGAQNIQGRNEFNGHRKNASAATKNRNGKIEEHPNNSCGDSDRKTYANPNSSFVFENNVFLFENENSEGQGIDNAQPIYDNYRLLPPKDDNSNGDEDPYENVSFRDNSLQNREDGTSYYKSMNNFVTRALSSHLDDEDNEEGYQSEDSLYRTVNRKSNTGVGGATADFRGEEKMTRL